MTNSVNTVRLYPKAWLWMTLAAAVIFAGFFQSFFSKLQQTDLSHHLHGISATLWLLLLIVQPFLYSRSNISLHRKLGKISFVLVPLLLIGGLRMVYIMLNSQDNYPPLVTYKLSFLDFFYMIQFTIFYILAIVHRKNIQLHPRYMAATVLVLIPPGLARLLGLFPVFTSFDAVLNTSYYILEFVIILLLIDDYRRGKIQIPYAVAFVCALLQNLLLNYIHLWEPWRKLMDKFAAL